MRPSSYIKITAIVQPWRIKGFRNKSDNEESDRSQVEISGETGLDEYFGAKRVAGSGWQRNKC